MPQPAGADHHSKALRWGKRVTQPNHRNTAPSNALALEAFLDTGRAAPGPFGRSAGGWSDAVAGSFLLRAISPGTCALSLALSLLSIGVSNLEH